MACRLAWVVGFTMGPFPGNERTWKPFNPILGETFELDLPERGVRFVAEQVRADVGRSVHGWQPGGLVWGNHTSLHLLQCWQLSTAACALWHNAAARADCSGLLSQITHQQSAAYGRQNFSLSTASTCHTSTCPQCDHWLSSRPTGHC